MAVDKAGGGVPICGDFKVTINPVIQVEQYPLPRIEEIFASLAGGEKFSKLDLRQAYLQMEVEENSRPLLTINTHKGLFRYKRMTYGIASAPAIWQRAMDQILQGVPGVQCYLDDIIVTGRDDREHLAHLDAVMTRLKEEGLKLNRKKCEFLQNQVSYCGHIIDKNGLHKTQQKVQAVVKAPAPENVSQLRSWLGFVNYYHKFLPNLAAELQPLHQLLQKDTKWHWGPQQEMAFKKVKSLISSDTVLTHFDPNKKLRLATDASGYGIGCVLSHVMEDGSEKPIAFASRTLKEAEKNYSQLEKEALSLVWGIKKFMFYLEGRHFTLITDHQPLTTIFHPQKAIPVTAAARIQRWALFLSGFRYDIEYKNTKKHANADALSRLPLPCTSEDLKHQDPVDVFHLKQIETLPVTVKRLRQETHRDPILAQVYQATMIGWPPKSNLEPQLLPYFRKREELTVHDGCLLWGVRVIVPDKLRRRVLEELHEGHVGVVKMKGLSRSYAWWPGIDSEIENTCKLCSSCQLTQNSPPSALPHRWEVPEKPWNRIHIDYAGPFLNHMYLVVVDAYTKWLEVKIMSSTTSTKTIEALREIFATHGLPAQLVSDNGPQFSSEEFISFLKANGIQELKSAPYHPKTNGLAERFVRTLKEALTADKSSRSIQHKVNNFLLQYRNCPHATTGNSPAIMLMGQSLRSRLDLMKPDDGQRMQNAQKAQTLQQNSGRMLTFEVGQTVLARNYGRGNRWVISVVHKQNGPISYVVKVGNTHWKRHLDQLRSTELLLSPEQEMEFALPIEKKEIIPEQPRLGGSETIEIPEVEIPICQESVIKDTQSKTHSSSSAKAVQYEDSPNSRSQTGTVQSEACPVPSTSEEAPVAPPDQEPKVPELKCRPKRNTRPPVWLKDYVSI